MEDRKIFSHILLHKVLKFKKLPFTKQYNQ